MHSTDMTNFVVNAIRSVCGISTKMDTDKTLREHDIDEGMLFDIVTEIERLSDVDLGEFGVEDLDMTVADFVDAVAYAMGVE